jgi:hypothetical protein
MKILIKILTISLLLINGIGALYGGLNLILDPSGEKMQMPLSFLEHTPFDNYLIPGIILLLVNGMFSFVALASVIFNRSYHPWFIIIQGVLLSGWIIVQILMIQIFYAPLHLPFLGIGICLIGCGIYFKRRRAKGKKILEIH